jgi:hypothetical protein
MKHLYVSVGTLFISTMVFMLWYFFLYQWSEQYLTHYEKTLHVCIKNCSRTDKLNRSCITEKESLATLSTRCQQCLNTLQENNDESILHTIVTLLESHKLTLVHYKHSTKEKKSWYSHYTTNVAFQGSMAAIYTFFEALSHNKKGIITIALELHTDSKQITHATATLSWITYKENSTKKSPST